MARVFDRIDGIKDVISPEARQKREAQAMIRIAELVFDRISRDQLKFRIGPNPAYSYVLPCIYKTTPFVEVQESKFALRHYGKHDDYGLLFRLEDEVEREAAICSPDRIFEENFASGRRKPITGPDAEEVVGIMRGVSEKLIGL